MGTNEPMSLPVHAANLVRARARLLARSDRNLKADLIKARTDLGLTQKQVADLMGVTRQAIQKLERYDSDPKMSTLRRYANAVGALVHHTVVPDLGQSAAVASAPLWELSMRGTTVVEMSPAGPQMRASMPIWDAANKKQSDFALGA
ncbi:helix-turn-helix transcriptional regulator [Microbacterium aquilitoris]|uniref:helix-turn-helix transcriptional regulator n=1 Tax=Microbacterium aquilitoris TaxID=3067307 RepID=UPI00288D6E4F|nr:helix-turn-helix transcriptional regulator [Microbacterium sp. KSW2-22]MDT3343872.1 helix-turn-helix transcriptional regulator [Microbacterium sp. KSW2-22]